MVSKRFSNQLNQEPKKIKCCNVKIYEQNNINLIKHYLWVIKLIKGLQLDQSGLKF